MKHSASGLDPQHSWAKVHPLCMGLWASSSYCLKGRGKVGIRRLHHTHTYLLHQQDRQDQGTAGQEPGHELVLLYPASCNCFSSHLTYFCSCYPKLLAQPCVLVTPSWTGREVKASQPLAAVPLQAQPFSKYPLAVGSTKLFNPPRRACNPQVWSEGTFILSRLQMLQSSIIFLQDPVSQSLKLTGPGDWILLTCILQSSHGSSAFAPLCKC